MIKSLIILVLLVIVCGGAALSRPSQESFVNYYADRAANTSSDISSTFARQAYEKYATTYTYSNYLLWATASKGGKVVFTGAFSQWFVRDQALATPEGALKSLLK